MPKNWGGGGSTTLNEEKRGMPLFNIVIVLPSEYKSIRLQGQERTYTKLNDNDKKSMKS